MTIRPLSIGLIALAAAACGGATATGSAVAALTGDAATGKALYEAQCLACHGADGRSGSAKMDAVTPTINDLAGAATSTLDGVGEMPGYSGTLANQDVANVLAYLAGL